MPQPLPPEPYLELKTELLPFGASGGSAEIVFSTNEAWHVVTETAPGDDGGWFSVGPLSGDAGEDMTVTVDVGANELYEPRGFTVVIRSESLEAKIEAVQLKKNVILLGDNRVEVSSGEQMLSVEVRSNVEYGIEIREGTEWISEAPSVRSGGLKTGEHVFSIAANPSDAEREGVIIFRDKGSDLSDELRVVQAGWVDPDPQRTALAAIYDAAGGSGWTRSNNWCTDKPLGEWYGVETDDGGNVTALRLADNGLSGTVSDKIASLVRLRHLDLSRNSLRGEISTNVAGKMVSSLDGLTELDTIDLSHNLLEGYVPDNWGDLPRLAYVNLSFNRIKSWFPYWEGLYENGRTADLILNNNGFYGDIPAYFQNLPDWDRLALQVIRQDYEGGGLDYDRDIHLPDFTFTDLRDGSRKSIRDVYGAGKMTMLFNWDPTQPESEALARTDIRRFHTLFGAQGFSVVAIIPEGDEYREAAERYVRGHDVPWAVVGDYADAGGRRIVLPAYPYPSYLLLDGTGRVMYDIFEGTHCSTNIPGEPSTVDFTARPFQHTDWLGKVFEITFGDSEYESTDYSMDKRYETLQTATRGQGVNIVLIGDAFTDIDMETGFYRQVMEFAMESFFALEPYKSYREYFNIYMVYAVSRDSYIRKSGGSTALGVKPDSGPGGIDCYEAVLRRLPHYYYLPVAPGVKVSAVGVIVNNFMGGLAYLQSEVMGPNYGFSGYSYGGRERSRGVFVHETAGHAFGLLGDEYEDSEDNPLTGEITESEKSRLRTAQNKGWFLNLSLRADPEQVYWSHLIGHPRYPYVGIYEGGYYFNFGVWRSEYESIMRSLSNIPYFNAIGRELIVRRIMELAGEEYSFENFLAKDSDEGRLGPNRQGTRPENGRTPYRHWPPVMAP